MSLVAIDLGKILMTFFFFNVYFDMYLNLNSCAYFETDEAVPIHKINEI